MLNDVQLLPLRYKNEKGIGVMFLGEVALGKEKRNYVITSLPPYTCTFFYISVGFLDVTQDGRHISSLRAAPKGFDSGVV
jgi:hypothetical protein